QGSAQCSELCALKQTHDVPFLGGNLLVQHSVQGVCLCLCLCLCVCVSVCLCLCLCLCVCVCVCVCCWCGGVVVVLLWFVCVWFVVCVFVCVCVATTASTAQEPLQYKHSPT